MSYASFPISQAKNRPISLSHVILRKDEAHDKKHLGNCTCGRNACGMHGNDRAFNS